MHGIAPSNAAVVRRDFAPLAADVRLLSLTPRAAPRTTTAVEENTSCNAKMAFRARTLQLDELTPPSRSGGRQNEREASGDPLERELQEFRRKVPQVLTSCSLSCQALVFVKNVPF
eukprot:SAG11_NODE_1366_length_5104_cov_3.710090_1_plen_116_part_00